MGPSDVAKIIGTTTQSLTRWKEAAGEQGGGKDGEIVELVPAEDDKPVTKKAQGPSPYAPTDPAGGLSLEEIAGVLEYKREHPSYGPAQLRAQLKRFRG